MDTTYVSSINYVYIAYKLFYKNQFIYKVMLYGSYYSYYIILHYIILYYNNSSIKLDIISTSKKQRIKCLHPKTIHP